MEVYQLFLEYTQTPAHFALCIQRIRMYLFKSGKISQGFFLRIENSLVCKHVCVCNFPARLSNPMHLRTSMPTFNWKLMPTHTYT